MDSGGELDKQRYWARGAAGCITQLPIRIGQVSPGSIKTITTAGKVAKAIVLVEVPVPPSYTVDAAITLVITLLPA